MSSNLSWHGYGVWAQALQSHISLNRVGVLHKKLALLIRMKMGRRAFRQFDINGRAGELVIYKFG